MSHAAALPLVLGRRPPGRVISAFSGDSPLVASYERDFPDMLMKYLTEKLNALSRRWDQERARIAHSYELEARNRFVRAKMLEMIHGLPERTPLNPKVVRSFDRDVYRVENVMFQSRPDFWVTGNLYVPTSGKEPYPGIISPCGHYPLGRMDPVLQCAYVNMVRNGFAVLAYDPVGQGERRYYRNPETGQTEVSADPIFEHSMPGQLMLLVGENLTQVRIWDGMRAIDYLISRPEVDAQRIGCTGHSGGGTLTLFIAAVDERVKCAVLNEGGGGQRWPMQISLCGRVGPSDVEQNLFPSALYGIDQEDLRVAIAPRPQLVTIEEYYPEFLQSRQRVLTRYRSLDAPDRFETAEATDPHSWTLKLRLATTDWFCRWFYGHPGPAEEPDFQVEPAGQLQCTPNGSTRFSRQGKTVFTIVNDRASQLPPDRRIPSNLAEWEDCRRELLSQGNKLLRIGEPEGELAVRNIVTTKRKGYRIEKVQFLSEPGIYIPAWVFVPDMPGKDRTAILYVDEAGKTAEGMDFGVLDSLARRGHLVISVDVRGIGETEPAHDPFLRSGGEFSHLFNVETALSYMAWFMDLSLFGMRVRDVLRSVDYVLSRHDVDPLGVRAVGKGMGALWVLFAAAQDRRILSAVCEGGLVSYRSLASADRYVHGANVFVRDILLHFDLPQVAGCVAGRNLVLLSPVDAMGTAVDLDQASETYRWAASAYVTAGASQLFRILKTRAGGDKAEEYLSMLRT